MFSQSLSTLSVLPFPFHHSEHGVSSAELFNSVPDTEGKRRYKLVGVFSPYLTSYFKTQIFVSSRSRVELMIVKIFLNISVTQMDLQWFK